MKEHIIYGPGCKVRALLDTVHMMMYESRRISECHLIAVTHASRLGQLANRTINAKLRPLSKAVGPYGVYVQITVLDDDSQSSDLATRAPQRSSCNPAGRDR